MYVHDIMARNNGKQYYVYLLLYSELSLLFSVQTDRFSLEAVDLGKLFKVKIRHDDANLSSDWFLDRVEVRDPDDDVEPYVFHCERWLAKKKDDGKLERSLYVKVYHATIMFELYYSRRSLYGVMA